MTMNKDAEATSKVVPDDASAEPGAEAPEKAAADDLASEASAAPDAAAPPVSGFSTSMARRAAAS